ncbi:hypothetical protein [Silvibacterium acidisoli]|uniref:hypothetical protein n=1 Tax=Acidobacteriaceae bacterium ZG23-2 TaxID=2883246 RepID=UPI00406C0093
MTNRSDERQSERQAERNEASEIQERGTLTPEGKKQGVTSHLPTEETEYMYRTEDNSDLVETEEETLRKSA